MMVSQSGKVKNGEVIQILRNSLAGFTLIELLVVISIIALLMSILMPSLGKAREMGKRVVCLTRQKQLVTACAIYANDYRTTPTEHGYNETRPEAAANDWGHVMVANTATTDVEWVGIGKFYELGYVEDYTFFYCPSRKMDAWIPQLWASPPESLIETPDGFDQRISVASSYILRCDDQIAGKGVDLSKVANKALIADFWYYRTTYPGDHSHKLKGYNCGYADGSAHWIKGVVEDEYGPYHPVHKKGWEEHFDSEF